MSGASSHASPADVWDIDALAAAPKVFPSETILASDDRIGVLLFEGAPYRGKPTRVFAWRCVPRLPPGEKAPGIILLHGGADLPMLWVNGTNDNFFWLPAWQQSYHTSSASQHTLALRVNMPHGHPPAGDPPEVLAFADSVVRDGAPSAELEAMNSGSKIVSVTHQSARPIIRAELNYSAESEGHWKQRQWLTIPATVTPAAVTAQRPAEATIYFLNLIDNRDCLVSTEHAFVTPNPVTRGNSIHADSDTSRTPIVP